MEVQLNYKVNFPIGNLEIPMSDLRDKLPDR